MYSNSNLDSSKKHDSKNLKEVEGDSFSSSSEDQFLSENIDNSSYHRLFNYWNAIKEKLHEILSPQDFDLWISPLQIKVLSEREFSILMPNLVFYQGFMTKFWEQIEHCKLSLGLDPVLVRPEVEGIHNLDEVTLTTLLSSPEEKSFEKSSLTQFPDPNQKDSSKDIKEKTQKISESLKAQNLHRNLFPNYTFDSFVRGPSNQFALASCLNVAENPGKAYNPLFVYGSTGLGKTHLLHAVGNRILEKNPKAVVTYISSERFMNEMIYCLRFNKMWDFRQKYRHCDLFLVDDIQFISGKKATQEEFFHTFNALYESKKQIVITSDQFPQDISDIEDRLRNRFQWGLITDIQPPDVEHRIAILFSKAEKLNINLTTEVAEYIATHAKRNVRELEGALHRIAAYSALHGRTIDRSLAIETFQNVLGEPPRNLRIELIQKVVADHFKIKISDLKSKKRQRALTIPRQIAMYLSRTMTKASFPEIGDKFGGKDHTTIMHAVKKIDSDRSKDLDLRAHIESLERAIEQQS